MTGRHRSEDVAFPVFSYLLLLESVLLAFLVPSSDLSSLLRFSAQVELARISALKRVPIESKELARLLK